MVLNIAYIGGAEFLKIVKRSISMNNGDSTKPDNARLVRAVSLQEGIEEILDDCRPCQIITDPSIKPKEISAFARAVSERNTCINGGQHFSLYAVIPEEDFDERRHEYDRMFEDLQLGGFSRADIFDVDSMFCAKDYYEAMLEKKKANR